MNRMRFGYLAMMAPIVPAAAALIAPIATNSQQKPGSNSVDFPNGDGISRTVTTNPGFDINNPFFKPLGTNGRTCATCHPVAQGMTISPDYATQLFAATQGLDPLFATVDGTNSPDADMTTLASRMANCSMLLTKGLIRVGRPIPANAEFTLTEVDDPYNFASAAELSLFRRPLPTTNLRFLSTVMWDGRELAPGGTVLQALQSQIKDAISGHEQGTAPPSTTEINQIISFETALYTSQIYDNDAGNLDIPPINAGPETLVNTPYFTGINNAFGLVRTPQPFNSNVFTFYDSWLAPNNPPTPPGRKPNPPAPPTAQRLAQMSVARGEQLFNTRQFAITGVAGLNDLLNKPRIMGTCSSCHSTTNVGSNSVPLLMNTGIADGSRRTPDMPLYTLKNKKTGVVVTTTDPGAALTSGKWADIGKFKVPALRGLENQSPYMHNGFSGDLLDVLDFYNNRFNIGLSEQDAADLKAFLTTL